MSQLTAALTRAIADLNAVGADWALIGGLAVSVRSEPRFTRDIDIAIAVTGDKDAERTVGDLLSRGYALSASLEQTDNLRLATVRLRAPGQHDEGVVVDLLFASSGIEAEIVGAAELLEALPGIACRVARTGHLLALKILSRDDEKRPQDAVDIQALCTVLDTTEFERAQAAVKLIEERGFHRDRDLSQALRTLRPTTIHTTTQDPDS